ncbi:MAG: dUTP diphosphatase [Brachybacterium sp.]|nr:dUTP diphosphatase [Brachybacterium sp.]
MHAPPDEHQLPVTLDAGATLPSRAHQDDAGLDLYSTEDVEIGPGERALVSTGVRLALPVGTVGMVCPRSGLAARHGVTVLNGPGIVDAGYRGEVKVALLNTDRGTSVQLHAGDRIAQLVILPVVPLDPVAVEDLPTTVRADGGFGSSGGFGARTTEAPTPEER